MEGEIQILSLEIRNQTPNPLEKKLESSEVPKDIAEMKENQDFPFLGNLAILEYIFS